MIDRRKFIRNGSLITLPILIGLPKLKAEDLKLAPNTTSGDLNFDNANRRHLSKITYAPTIVELKKVKKIGFQKFVEEQLNAPKEDDKDVLQKIKNLKLDIKYDYLNYHVNEVRPLNFLGKDMDYCRKEFEKNKEKGWFEWIRPGMEVASANWIRAVYSPWQVREMMVEFWHNHFSVTLNADMMMGSFIPSYDRDVIRKNVFGNFRAFVEDVAKSPAMLYYLNNKSSKASPANENYARELFELHTLGQEHYFNNLYDRWRDVPGALEGKPVGYIDEDVYETARAFTGWTVADGCSDWSRGYKEEFANTWEFYYHEVWHDNYQKRILGNEIKSNMPPMYDGKKVLDLLAAHPGTAKNLCKKLLQRFVGDNYPISLLQKAIESWLANVNHPEQIKIVLSTIFNSEEFLAYKGGKVKRPYEYIVSVARVTDAEFTPSMHLHWITMSLGYKPLMWPSPAGHPDKDAYWMGPGAMISRWKTTGAIMWWKDMNTFKFNLTDATPMGINYGQMVDHWSDKIIGKRLDEKYRSEVIQTIAYGNRPEVVPPANEGLESQLTVLVQFLISTPDFQIR